jgi:hypothetical protein
MPELQRLLQIMRKREQGPDKHFPRKLNRVMLGRAEEGKGRRCGLAAGDYAGKLPVGVGVVGRAGGAEPLRKPPDLHGQKWTPVQALPKVGKGGKSSVFTILLPYQIYLSFALMTPIVSTYPMEYRDC